jgi:endonuclease G
MNRKIVTYLALSSLLLLGSCHWSSRHHEALMSGIRESKNIIENSLDGNEEAQNQQTGTSAGNAQGGPNADAQDVLLPAKLNDRPEQQLVRAGYVVSYNSATRDPNWVAWHLTADHTTGPYKRQGVKFHEDEDVDYPRATDADYRGSGYDRGHMCPSADNRWSEQAQEDCFLFTNMCPQSHDLNSGDWNDLEDRCRKWADEYGDIYIVSGPVFKEAKGRSIGQNKVRVPDGFFKVVVCMRGTPKGIGFYCPNEDGHRDLFAYATSIDEIERLTGIDFFASLPNQTEQAVEKAYDANDWN